MGECGSWRKNHSVEVWLGSGCHPAQLRLFLKGHFSPVSLPLDCSGDSPEGDLDNDTLMVLIVLLRFTI